MNSSFLLGSEWVFDSHNMIIHDSKSGKNINVSGVKGRCLSCLITHSEQGIISKKQLFDEVWEKFGLYVSDNNLLQTIYALRRDLKTIGATDLIMTHPRLGYQINPAYLISPISEPPQMDTPPHVHEKLLDEIEEDVLTLDVYNTQSEIECKIARKQSALKATLTLHGKKLIVISLVIFSVVLSSLLTLSLCDNVDLIKDNGSLCADNLFIVENMSVPKNPLIVCRCDNKSAIESKVDWYV